MKKNVRVAINGFGRIGRLAFRQMFGAEGYEIVAINDLTSPKMLAHLLKYDTAQGNYVAMGHTVTYKDAVLAEDGKTVVTPGSITVDGKEITIYAEPKAINLPWKELQVDVVLECTGFYCSKEKSQAHIDAGARKPIAASGSGNAIATPQKISAVTMAAASPVPVPIGIRASPLTEPSRVFFSDISFPPEYHFVQ